MENIVQEIVLFSDGGAPITPVIAAKVINYFKDSATGSGLFNKLTEREKEILQLVVDGYLYKEIAHQKSITVDGIKKHISKIYEKLQVRTRSEAIKKYFTEML